MADHAGNIYIADKRAHAIRKVRTDGTIVTVAGINVAGSGTTNPAPATSVALNNPNGLWVRGDGLFYILDRDNGYIRRVDTNGLMTTIVNHGFAIPGGRGLWVSEDESRIFYAAGTQVMTWDPTNGLAAFASGFSDLANIAMQSPGTFGGDRRPALPECSGYRGMERERSFPPEMAISRAARTETWLSTSVGLRCAEFGFYPPGRFSYAPMSVVRFGMWILRDIFICFLMGIQRSRWRWRLYVRPKPTRNWGW